MRTRLIGIAALASALLITTAGAKDVPAAGLTLADLSTWITGHGFTPESIKDNDGTFHLRVPMNGVKLGIYQFDCKAGVCGSMQFSAGWATHGKFDTAQMNAWNRDKRWCRGYYDAENDPWVELDVDLTPGGTYESLDDQFKVFQKCVANFQSQYGL
jgi:hypothetical protein